MRRFFVCFIVGAMFFSACAEKPQVEGNEPSREAPTLTPEPPPISLYLPPYLPEDLANGYHSADGLVIFDAPGSYDLSLDVGDEAVVAEWVYVLAAPFPTITDSIRSQDMAAFWSGGQNAGLPFDELLMDGSAKALFERLWGPAPLGKVRVLAKGDLLPAAWENRTTWAIIPFEWLNPQWKVIALDGQSPLDKDFNRGFYPLVVPFSVIGKSDSVAEFLPRFGPGSDQPVFRAANLEPEKLTKVMVTGVTALVGGTAYLMKKNGATYPAFDIGELLRSADILHINNEVSFSPNCSANPFVDRANLILCSDSKNIQLLEAIGTDVVELAGDHFIDLDAEAMLDTIAMYEERGWQYYGGGKNYMDGAQPAYFEHHGNRIAFIGCNAKTPGYARASETSPGAIHCDMALMAEKVKEAIAAGYQPIFTFQHLEYYSYQINPNLVEDFHAAAEAGALIVSGSQAHQPHAFEFYKGAMLHYGLGNLFFDQYDESMEQRQAFIDIHNFYDGKYINTELVTIQFIDWARPRFMTENERETLLKDIFFASGW